MHWPQDFFIRCRKFSPPSFSLSLSPSSLVFSFPFLFVFLIFALTFYLYYSAHPGSTLVLFTLRFHLSIAPCPSKHSRVVFIREQISTRGVSNAGRNVQCRDLCSESGQKARVNEPGHCFTRLNRTSAVFYIQINPLLPRWQCRRLKASVGPADRDDENITAAFAQGFSFIPKISTFRKRIYFDCFTSSVCFGFSRTLYIFAFFFFFFWVNHPHIN